VSQTLSWALPHLGFLSFGHVLRPFCLSVVVCEGMSLSSSSRYSRVAVRLGGGLELSNSKSGSKLGAASGTTNSEAAGLARQHRVRSSALSRFKSQGKVP
jgi:hypothetical protein